MDSSNPVMIWAPKQTPSKEPKFHILDKFEGAGKSINDMFRGESSGWCLRRGWFINRVKGLMLNDIKISIVCLCE